MRLKQDLSVIGLVITTEDWIRVHMMEKIFKREKLPTKMMVKILRLYLRGDWHNLHK